MKTMYKTVTLAIMLLVTININQVYASTNEQTIQAAVSSIQEVIYDHNAKVYYGLSKAEQDGGQWVIYICDKKYSKDSLKWLNKKFKNKSFEISYSHDTNSNEYKIIGLKWR
ncbi:hypothetical protein [Paenibacillus sp. ISL-20]|uniref:hypothetical protein n=1 Tax=Paenibacillus sp. ISL-20 TaxID=2819163 RepID=UPI001BE97483|nr:hypothetical protein [Paenibacillus sp. ISL-20]MBT2759885.1 hypothetical protein [Paenibacillus sp. ISL-20]